jgi:hypothetical protein
MALRLSGDGVGYGCTTHGWNGYLSSCEECEALHHLCRIYGATPEELGDAIEKTKEDRDGLDETSGFRYNA